MIIKAIICLFKGHDVNPDESIVGDVMTDKRNWLCKCHRCGLYEMHDGAILNRSITLTRKGAYQTKRDFERDVMQLREALQIRKSMELERQVHEINKAERKTEDVRENVRGEWEQAVSGCAILMRCNQCKNAIPENDFFEICRKVNHGSKLLDFCPNCGADMRGEQDG